MIVESWNHQWNYADGYRFNFFAADISFPSRSGIESNSKTRYLERNPEASAIQKPIENGLAWETTNKVGHFTDPCSPGEEKSSPFFGGGHKACGDALSSVEISGYEELGKLRSAGLSSKFGQKMIFQMSNEKRTPGSCLGYMSGMKYYPLI